MTLGWLWEIAKPITFSLRERYEIARFSEGSKDSPSRYDDLNTWVLPWSVEKLRAARNRELAYMSSSENVNYQPADLQFIDPRVNSGESIFRLAASSLKRSRQRKISTQIPWSMCHNASHRGAFTTHPRARYSGANVSILLGDKVPQQSADVCRFENLGVPSDFLSRYAPMGIL